jgi:2-dehydro-3-deoxygalactonokinase
MSPRPDTAVLALDWGTSSARAYRVGRDGAVVERREAPLGVMHVAAGQHAVALRRLLGDWAALEVPRIASGMIGSRQGWLEVPYVECPADAAALVAGIRATPGRELSIVPGLVCRDAGGVPDVLRGEETQILGAVAEDDAAVLAVLPGTHSKWVYVADGRIVAFSTYMTGELFAVLLQHSILGRLASRPSDAAAPDSEAFADGVGKGLRSDGLTHTIFAARSRCLLGELGPADVGDWLSGVLIGHEIAAARRWAGDFAPRAAPVRIIGSHALVACYRAALRVAGVPSVAAPPEAAARGLYRIAERAGMVS